MSDPMQDLQRAGTAWRTARKNSERARAKRRDADQAVKAAASAEATAREALEVAVVEVRRATDHPFAQIAKAAGLPGAGGIVTVQRIWAARKDR